MAVCVAVRGRVFAGRCRKAAGESDRRPADAAAGCRRGLQRCARTDRRRSASCGREAAVVHSSSVRVGHIDTRVVEVDVEVHETEMSSCAVTISPGTIFCANSGEFVINEGAITGVKARMRRGPYIHPRPSLVRYSAISHPHTSPTPAGPPSRYGVLVSRQIRPTSDGDCRRYGRPQEGAPGVT